MNYGKKSTQKREKELTSKSTMIRKKFYVIFCKSLLVCVFAVMVIGACSGVGVIRGIIAQQLVKAADGKGVIPVFEILNMTYAEKNYLRERDFTRLEQSLEADHNISLGGCVYRLWHKEPRRINEDTVKRLFGDQFKLMMNRLGDHSGWKPLATGI